MNGAVVETEIVSLLRNGKADCNGNTPRILVTKRQRLTQEQIHAARTSISIQERVSMWVFRSIFGYSGQSSENLLRNGHKRTEL